MDEYQIKVCNDYIQRYQDTLHVLGFHLNELSLNVRRREVEDKIERVEEAKRKCHNQQWSKELNKIRRELEKVCEGLEVAV